MPPLRVRGYLAALPSIIKEKVTELTYRRYVTDSMRLQGEGKYISSRWFDSVEPPKPVKEDNRPAEIIVSEIWKRAKIKRKGGENDECIRSDGEDYA